MTKTLVIEGMHCEGCVKRVVEGVKRAGAVAEEVRIGEARVGVSSEEEVGKVVAALEKMGFEARVAGVS